MDDAIEQRQRGWAPEPDLVERFVTEAFVTYGPEVSAHLRSLVRDGADAEDLGQEAFLRLYSEAVAGRQPDNVRAWLHRVAVNLAMSRGRHLQVQTRTAPRLLLDDGADATDDLVERRDEERRLREALADLPTSDREILLLAAAGYGGPEIALHLGRTQTSTRTLLCRARARLRARLAISERAAAC